MSIFKFKQFSITQANTAMKVGTDGVLLGAWVDVDGMQNVLDAGTGTGLIALMLAQRKAQAKVLGVDTSSGAILDAQTNVAESPFADRVTVQQSSLEAFVDQQFDLVVSNPPYFENALRTPRKDRNEARHTRAGGLANWLEQCIKRTAEGGRIALILPAGNLEDVLSTASALGWHSKRLCRVRGHAQKPVKRILIELHQQSSETIEEDLIVEVSRHRYTEDYINLTSPFYLNM